MTKPASAFPSRSLLQHIWAAHRLGDVQSMTRPAAGSVNNAVIVNGTHVIRFNINPEKGAARFKSEELAYSCLRRTGVPVPEPIALDLSQRLVPYAFLITSKLEGQPLAESWTSLPAHEQENTAYLAGRHLAHIHNQTYACFGSLHTLADGGFERWADYVADFVERYAARAADLELLTPDSLNRLRDAIDQYRPLFNQVTRGALVHSDYHFENLLQAGGVITGVVDFEWALAGDPAWDFIAEDAWEQVCPGSRAFVYEGYTRHRPLAADHAQRVAVYKLLLRLETLVDVGRQGADAQVAAARDSLLDALQAVEQAAVR